MSVSVHSQRLARLKRLESAFEQLRRRELARHAGKWVLLSSRAEVRYFEQEQQAVTAGYETERGEPFLVKQMLDEDPVISVSMASLDFHP